ncbi:MAG: nucleoside deaminase [Micropruina sp.]
MNRWQPAMRLALDEAAQAPSHGDVPVGAVLLGPSGAVVARGHNERELSGDPTAHAEVLTLRRAAEAAGSWRLDEHTLVVTLEPCTMCAGALLLARVRRLVLGTWDPKAGAVSSVFDVVRDPRLNHRVEVVGGIEAEACADLLQHFFEAQR